MIKLDSPLSFRDKIELPNGKFIIYKNLYELCQGCPEVGTLIIDNSEIRGKVFGGPLIYNDKFVFAPFFKKKWFNSGFYLARIDMNTFEIRIFGKMQPIIDLIKVEENVVYFYNSLDRTQMKTINLIGN